MTFELTDAEVDAIKRGACKLTRSKEPECEAGQRIIALMSEPRWAGVPEDKASRTEGSRWPIPAEPLIVIVIRRVIPQLRGWQIRFDVEDYRPEKAVYLAKGSGYTTSPKLPAAIDDLRVLDPEAEKKLEMQRRLTAARGDKVSELTKRDRERQERRVRMKLREVVRDLSPEDSQELLAWIERAANKALDASKQAA